MVSNLENQFHDLKRWFENCPFAIVAFSGGVDSSLVCFLANRFLGSERVLAVISDSPSLKRKELDAATAFCQRYQINMEVVLTQELSNPAYVSNFSNRCFYCKQTLYGDLKTIANARTGSWILNGTNADDLSDYRPGLKAANEFRIRSPLAACGIDKQSVRELARWLELECWDKPASPCLSSRIAYGQPVTDAKLRQIETAEEILNHAGFAIVRCRHFGSEARIEVPAQDVPRLERMMETLEPSLRELGFERVVLDLEGFVSGKLNRVLGNAKPSLPVIR